MEKLDLPTMQEHLKLEQLKSKVPHPQKCIKILGKLGKLQFYLFIEGSNEITIDKNLEIIY